MSGKKIRMGQGPQDPDKGLKGADTDREAGRSVVMTDPRKEDMMYVEAVKNLRTNLQFTGADIKVVVMTSCFPNEGKSDLTFQLAKELGNIQKRVLLLDADIRKSAYASRYKVGKKIVGLSHYLSGQARLEDIIYSTNNEGMDILFAGTMAPNPSELLESKAMEELLAVARKRYDYILVDTPPAADMSDAAIIAKWCDGVVLVLESGRVGYRLAQKVKAQVARAGCRMLGVVLNKVDMQSDRYYGRYGRYGYYGKYGYRKYGYKKYGYGRYGYGGYGYYGGMKEESEETGGGEA